jgi:GDPmannose 4,6-dehydratase
MSASSSSTESSFALRVTDCRQRWEGEDVDEVGRCDKTGRILVKVDPMYFRPAEVDILHGDPRKAERVLGWRREVDFDTLCKEMVESDVKGARAEDQN